jgi:phage N-6-adenine-methyltransferase
MTQLLAEFDYTTLAVDKRDDVLRWRNDISTARERIAGDVVLIGHRLIAVKAALPHGTWGKWLQAEFAWSADTAGRFIKIAEAFPEIPHGAEFDQKALLALAAETVPEGARQDAVELAQQGVHVTLPIAQSIISSYLEASDPPSIPIVDEMPINESHPVGYAGLYADDDAVGYGKAVCSMCAQTHNRWTPVRAGRWRCDVCQETTNDDAMQLTGRVEFELSQRSEDAKKKGKKKPQPLAQHSSKSVEWYTPAKYLVAAREVFGGEIELDPASNPYANQVVRAQRIYTAEDDALQHEWHAKTAWVNPPYGKTPDGLRSMAGVFIEKLLKEWGDEHVGEAILLVNAATSEKWFAPLWQFSICFPDHRIKFWNGSTTATQPTHASVFVYLGTRRKDFAEVFKQFGPVVPGVIRRGE